MTKTESSIIFAFLTAIPIEVVNFFFAAVPIDVGIPVETPWYFKLIFYQWIVVHFPGLLFMAWSERTRFEVLTFLVLPMAGYFDTGLLILGVIAGVRWVRAEWRRRHAKAE
jgi:hypothetical protein